MTGNNPMKFGLEKIGDDNLLIEKDGGNVYCPLPRYVKGAATHARCGTQCPWFFGRCNIPDAYGIEVPEL